MPAMKGNTADPRLPAEKVNPKTVPSFLGYIFESEVTRGVPKRPDPRPKIIQANIKKLKLEVSEKRITPRVPIKMLKVRILRSPKLSEKMPRKVSFLWLRIFKSNKYKYSFQSNIFHGLY